MPKVLLSIIQDIIIIIIITTNYISASSSLTRSLGSMIMLGRTALRCGSLLILFSSSSVSDQSKISRFCFILSLLKLFGTKLTPCSYTHLRETYNAYTNYPRVLHRQYWAHKPNYPIDLQTRLRTMCHKASLFSILHSLR